MEQLEILTKMEHLIVDIHFWERIHYYLSIIESPAQVLRLVNSNDKNCMRYLYDAIYFSFEEAKLNSIKTKKKEYN